MVGETIFDEVVQFRVQVTKIQGSFETFTISVAPASGDQVDQLVF